MTSRLYFNVKRARQGKTQTQGAPKKTGLPQTTQIKKKPGDAGNS